jgi:hypothetical protein
MKKPAPRSVRHANNEAGPLSKRSQNATSSRLYQAMLALQLMSAPPLRTRFVRDVKLEGHFVRSSGRWLLKL